MGHARCQLGGVAVLELMRYLVPVVSAAPGYLCMNQKYKKWIANLYVHIFAIEKNPSQLGSQQGKD